MQFRSFQSRILFYFLGLMALIQITGFTAFNAVLTRNTRARTADTLEVGAHVFTRLVKERTGQLVVAIRLLSGDFAFKTAYFTGDQGTVLSALENHRVRVNANMMMIVSMDNRVIADTLHPDRHGTLFPFPSLIRFSQEYGTAASIVFIENYAYQMVVVPLQAPEPVAWICAGFLMDDALAIDLQKTALSNVSFLRATSTKKWNIVASTLPLKLRKSLLATMSKTKWEPNKSVSLNMNGSEHVSLILPLGKRKEYGIQVVLQRSLSKELQPFQPLRLTLLALLIGGLAGTLIGAFWIARGVTQPVKLLVQGARKIAAGDFTQTVTITQEDELGELANAFNEMTLGLAERDRTRDLLGKVVSPEIAEKLLHEGLELGGEEREVTILFSDIRNFTSLSERYTPSAVLDILNSYLTEMSAIVEYNGGVVDKYVGDAVMALFGAPISHEDDADRALRAAMEMIQTLYKLNADYHNQNLPPLEIGIGINTAVVVAGNMGSQNRLNYTVIGDGVNIASRLESLTKEKEYNAKIIVSGATLKKAKAKYNTHFLGEVVVKGKSETTPIYALQVIPPQPNFR